MDTGSKNVGLYSFEQGNADYPHEWSAKRVFDVCLAAIGLLILSPVFVLIALLIKTQGSGPVVFKHERIGRNGVVFQILKFRTMTDNAHDQLSEYLQADSKAAEEWRANHKIDKDRRITPLGRALRASSLDELPQLWNILRGDMSMVGPRPITSAELVLYGSDISIYHQIKPGLTGLWQVSGRSTTTYPERVNLDTHYVLNHSFWGDIGIILKTIPAVLSARGAR